MKRTSDKQKIEQSTSSLEKTGELVDLASVDLDSKPSSPYGMFLAEEEVVYGEYVVVFEKFELADIVLVKWNGQTLSRTLRNKGNV
jgi:hypothetical protein